VFGRSNRIVGARDQARERAEAPIRGSSRWRHAQHIGYVTLAETIDKLYAGHVLSDDENKMVARSRP
jgi:hypothetical protein